MENTCNFDRKNIQKLGEENPQEIEISAGQVTSSLVNEDEEKGKRVDHEKVFPNSASASNPPAVLRKFSLF